MLKDISLTTAEDDLVSSVSDFKINDSQIKNDTEIDYYNSQPSSKVKDYFDKTIDRNDSEKIEAVSDNSQNISMLVKNYFDESFDKHTFN